MDDLIQNSSEDLNHYDSYIDEGLETIDTLEQLQGFVVGKRIAQESLTSNEMTLIDITMKSIHARLGMSEVKQYSLAIESFGSEDQHITLENGIVDTLKAIWEKIKAFFAAFIKKVKELFDRHKTEQAEVKTKELESALGVKTNSKMKSPKIQNHSLSNWFGLYKEVDSITVWAIGDSVLQMSKNYTRVIDIFLAGLNHIKGITDLETNMDYLDDLEKTIADHFGDDLKYKNWGKSSMTQTGTYYRYFPGNDEFRVIENDKTDYSKFSFYFTKSTVEDHNNAQEQDCEAMNLKEIENMISLIQTFVETKNNLGKNILHMEEASKIINSIIDNIRNENFYTKTDDIHARDHKVGTKIKFIERISHLSTNLMKTGVRLGGYIDIMIQGGITYATLSEKNLV